MSDFTLQPEKFQFIAKQGALDRYIMFVRLVVFIHFTKQSENQVIIVLI